MWLWGWGDNINWSKGIGCLICFIVATISTALTVKIFFLKERYTHKYRALHLQTGRVLMTGVQVPPGHVPGWQHLSPADAQSKWNLALWMEPRKVPAIQGSSRELLKPRFLIWENCLSQGENWSPLGSSCSPIPLPPSSTEKSTHTNVWGVSGSFGEKSSRVT